MEYKEVINKPNMIWVSESAITKRINAEFYNVEVARVISKIKHSFGDRVLKLSDYIILMDTGKNLSESCEERRELKYLKVNNLKEILLDYSSLSYINKESSILNNKLLEFGDLIFARVGVTSGVSSVIANHEIKGYFSDNIIRIRLKQEKLNPLYCSVFLSTTYGKTLINRHLKGTARPLISYEIFEDILIPIPSPEIQKYIGDKVRRAEELREEAKRLKEEAEDTLDRELKLNELHMKLKDSKKKYGWRDIELLKQRIDSDYYADKFIIKEEHLKNHTRENMFLNDLTEVIFTGKKLIENENGEEVCYIQSGDISSNFLDVNNKVKVNTDKLRLLEQKDILLAKDGETIGKLAINYSDKKLILNEHTYCLRLKQTHKIYSGYIYYLLRNELLNDLIKREATGSAQKGLNQDFTTKIVIPMIDQKIISRLDELEELRCKNIYQSKQLIQEAKQDVEDLIEGNFDMSKLTDTTTEE